VVVGSDDLCPKGHSENKIAEWMRSRLGVVWFDSKGFCSRGSSILGAIVLPKMAKTSLVGVLETLPFVASDIQRLGALPTGFLALVLRAEAIIAQ
jgi:hypothetical protein